MLACCFWFFTMLLSPRYVYSVNNIVNEDRDMVTRFVPEEILIEEYHPTIYESFSDNRNVYLSKRNNNKPDNRFVTYNRQSNIKNVKLKIDKKESNMVIPYIKNYNKNKWKSKKMYRQTPINSINIFAHKVNNKNITSSKLNSTIKASRHRESERSDVDTMEKLDEQETTELNEWISLNEAADKILKQQNKNVENRIFTEHYISNHNKPKKAWPQKTATTDFIDDDNDMVPSSNRKPAMAKVVANTDDNGKFANSKPICDYCHNEGLCVFRKPPANFKCYCRFGYSGRVCELRSVENHRCLPNTCFNGGTCIEKPRSKGGYHCKCKKGYHGQQCGEMNVIHWTW